MPALVRLICQDCLRSLSAEATPVTGSIPAACPFCGGPVEEPTDASEIASGTPSSLALTPEPEPDRGPDPMFAGSWRESLPGPIRMLADSPSHLGRFQVSASCWEGAASGW